MKEDFSIFLPKYLDCFEQINKSAQQVAIMEANVSEVVDREVITFLFLMSKY